MMTDDLITMRESELRDLKAEAWDDGFEEGQCAGRGDEYSPNPFKAVRCGWPSGCATFAEDGKYVCAQHALVIELLTRPRES